MRESANIMFKIGEVDGERIFGGAFLCAYL